MDFTQCKRGGFIKQIGIDSNLVESLKISSGKKLYSQRLLVLNDETATSKITLAYDALRELLEALAIIKGYKIYNHECYTPFLKEILNESRIGDTFDKFRKIRNDINYYGKDFSASDAELILKGIISLVEEVNRLIK